MSRRHRRLWSGLAAATAMTIVLGVTPPGMAAPPDAGVRAGAEASPTPTASPTPAASPAPATSGSPAASDWPYEDICSEGVFSQHSATVRMQDARPLLVVSLVGSISPCVGESGAAAGYGFVGYTANEGRYYGQSFPLGSSPDGATFTGQYADLTTMRAVCLVDYVSGQPSASASRVACLAIDRNLGGSNINVVTTPVAVDDKRFDVPVRRWKSSLCGFCGTCV